MGWMKVLFVAAAVITSCPALAGPVYYRLTNLGTLPGYEYSRATAINDNGTVVGYAGASEATRAALFDSSGAYDLGSLGGNSRALDINNSGAVVGVSRLSTSQFNATTGAFLFQGGSLANIGSLAPGTAHVSASGINEAGQIVGDSGTGDNTGQVAILYSGGNMTGLLQGHPQGQGSYATAINDLGDAVGFFGSGACFSGPAAWVFSGGLLTELTLADNGALPCTMGVSNDINNSGDIVGRMLFEGQDWRAFLYRGGVISNLGTLGGDFSDAKAINSHGQVVGASSTRRFDSAFLYQDDLLYDLNNMLLDNQLGWQLIDAQDINDNGQIAGEACYAAPVRHCFAVRLDPTDVPYDGPNGGVVPTPTTVSLVIFALAALGLQKRRSDFS